MKIKAGLIDLFFCLNVKPTLSVLKFFLKRIKHSIEKKSIRNLPSQFQLDLIKLKQIFSRGKASNVAPINRNVSFANAIFKDSATFKYTNFNDGVSFNNVNFKQDLNLKYTDVRGEFDITNMKVAYDINSKYTNINGKSFSAYQLKNR